MSHPWARYVVIILSAVVLQRAAFEQLTLLGVSADLLLVVAVAAGMVGGVERGATVGFAAGLAMDALMVTPFGLGALSSMTAGLVAAWLEQITVHSARWLTALVAALASVAGVVVFAVLGTMISSDDFTGLRLALVALLVGAWSAVLVFPLQRVSRWAEAHSHRFGAALR